MSRTELAQVLDRVYEELESGANAARIKQIADACPEARAEILAFAAEWVIAEDSDLPDEVLKVDRTVARHVELLERLWEKGPHQDVDPFAGLSVDELQRIASQCRIDKVVLRQLVRGLIEEATIPGILITWLATATNAKSNDVWNHLCIAHAFSSADFFAPSGTQRGAKIVFADAIRDSAMSKPDKQFWSELVGP
jgi:hypothetical protein